MLLDRADPELASFTLCQSCGDEVGWVQVMPLGKWVTVTIEPHARGELALLRDGKRAVSLREAPGIDPTLDETYGGPRFWAHRRTCAPRGMLRVGHVAGRFMSGQSIGDPGRDALRRRLLAEDRAREQKTARYDRRYR